MSKKSMAAGLAVLAILMTSGLTGLKASAETGGHLVSEVEHTNLVLGVNPKAGDDSRMSFDGGASEVACNSVRGDGTAVVGTASEFAITTENTACYTVGAESAEWTLHPNGCIAKLRVASGEPATTEHTSELSCLAGEAMSSTHPGCTFTIPPQGGLNGLTYTPVTVEGKHALTIDVNITYAVQFHAGVCVFLGTNHTVTFSGSTILQGRNTAGEPVDITTT